MKGILLLVFFSSLFFYATGQSAPLQNGGIDHLMRSNGRIFVVVAVMLVILSGIILYLIRIERKIKRIEKDAV